MRLIISYNRGPRLCSSQVQAVIDEEMCINCGKCYMTCNDSGYQVHLLVHFSEFNSVLFHQLLQQIQNHVQHLNDSLCSSSIGFVTVFTGYNVRPRDPPSFGERQLYWLHPVPQRLSNHRLHQDGYPDNALSTQEGCAHQPDVLKGRLKLNLLLFYICHRDGVLMYNIFLSRDNNN